MKPWKVMYNLAYDRGGYCFSRHYRTRLGALISRWIYLHIYSCGGHATMPTPAN